MSDTPIVIPNEMIKDRAVRALIMSWVHLHARLRVCRTRVHWNNTSSRHIEKSRRKEQWVVIARIFEIERTLIKWCARKTHHRDIWMSKKRDAKPSTMWELHQRYYETRRLSHMATKHERKQLLINQKHTVRTIRSLIRSWMLAILQKTYPQHAPIPSPIKLHPTELTPRKIRRASKTLNAELTAVAVKDPTPPKRSIHRLVIRTTARRWTMKEYIRELKNPLEEEPMWQFKDGRRHW